MPTLPFEPPLIATYQRQLEALYEWAPLEFHDRVIHFVRQLQCAHYRQLESVSLYRLLVGSDHPNAPTRFDLPAPFSIGDFIETQFSTYLRLRHEQPRLVQERLVS